MTRIKRLRRTLILCCHCLRNLAFYNAGPRNAAPRPKKQFWVNVGDNFLDIAVLEWCKLFADSRGKHFWRKTISDPAAFWDGLLQKLGQSEAQFDDFVNQMRTYRDKFVAHLDSEEVMHIPRLDVAINSVVYLYDYLLAHEEEHGCFWDASGSASSFYTEFLDEGTVVYDSIKT
jgi:hypothetical protein